MGKIVLIDGNSIANRAYFGLPDLTTSKGAHTNAVLGFLNIMTKILDEEKPEYLAVAFDVHAKTFRHEAFADYKGQRGPMEENLASQFPLLKEFLKAMNVLVMEKAGYEADDIIGTLAKRAEAKGMAATVISGDKDLLQLASDNIVVRIPSTSKGKTVIKTYTREAFTEEFELEDPSQVIDLKALMGDSSDNYKGVEGIGKVTATKLLQQYKNIDGIYEHLAEIKGKTGDKLAVGKEDAYFCRWLATIKTDCELDFTFEEALQPNIYTAEAYALVKEYEMKSLLGKFSGETVATAGETSKKADNPVLPVKGEVAVIDDLETCEVFFSELAKEKPQNIGMAFAGEIGKDGFSYIVSAVCLEGAGKSACIIPEGFLTSDVVFERINSLLEKGFTLCGYDIKPVSELFKEENRGQVSDLAVGMYLLNPDKYSYTAPDVARDLLYAMIPEEKEVLGKQSLNDAILEFDMLGEVRGKAVGLLSDYAHVAAYSYEPIVAELKGKGMYSLYTDVELPLIYALREMEINGVRVDREALNIYGSKLLVEMKSLETEIYKFAGQEFNINSPKQLGEILFEKLKLPGGKLTKTGYSTSADVLEKLRSEDPIVDLVLKYRTCAKLKGTYADGMGGFIREDGRIHTCFNQTVTATGRLSSTEPNLQNIPIRMEMGREIRKMFVPAEGCIFVDADYSQIELRLLAHMSEDESLIEAYNSGKDIHATTASKVFNVPMEEVTPRMRSNAKAVNFGIIYGMSSFGLGAEINVSRKEAEAYIAQYFETYPSIKNYLDGLVDEARKKGYSVTLFGRRRPITDINDKKFMIRAAAERIAMNSPIQGTAADIMKIALVNVYKAFRQEGLKSKLLLQVHDELLVEAVKDELDKVKEILEREMSAAAILRVPLSVSTGVGDNWDDAH
ncbi:MAG: DNA polymerase I [Lachnospiraceae bacterium]|nr:DNA polymerase I [Lachnospiraceae bacterium]